MFVYEVRHEDQCGRRLSLQKVLGSSFKVVPIQVSLSFKRVNIYCLLEYLQFYQTNSLNRLFKKPV